MITKTLPFTALFLLSAYAAAQDCPIEGTWRSNEAKTVASMNDTGDVTEEQRQVLQNGFFGRVTFKMNCEEFTTLYKDEASTIPYTSVASSGDRVIVTFTDPRTGVDVKQILRLEKGGNCYSVPIEELGFREYFCRVQ